MTNLGVDELHPATGKPIDMSYAILRSVSVMYAGYLKNMGVRSTMVMPLMKEGRLWGLISAMHHSGPRHVPYEARMASEFLAHMLSLLMAAKDDAEGYTNRLRMTAVTDQLVEALSREPDLHKALGNANGPNLLSQLPCHGAAIAVRGNLSLLGATPSEADVRELVGWLGQTHQTVYATDRLAEEFAPAASYKATSSGLLAARLSATAEDFLLWFRPEHLTTVNWAGDPKKPVDIHEAGGELRLEPRTSFALWKESVTGRSEPWSRDEREAAGALRQAIIQVIMSRAEEMERINRRLAEANTELDSFAYVASHDLKEPLRGVHHLASFLKIGQQTNLDEQGRQQIETILKLTRRMDDLIESLLQYSRTGRLDLVLEPNNIDGIVDEALLSVGRLIEDKKVVVRRTRPLGFALCDGVRVCEVFANLISNAAKYNDKADRWMEIGFEETAPPRYYVRDNGIGICERSQERIFEIFRRIHAPDEFGGGVGAGLAIARRSVERHGGRLWVRSEPDKGSTFYFTLEPEKQ